MLGDPRTQRFIPAPSLDLIAATDIASDGGLRDDQDPRPIITATAWIARQANQQIPVQPSFKKYSAMLVGQIISTSLRHPVPQEGRWPSSQTLGWDAVDAAASGANEIAGQASVCERSTGAIDERRCGVRQSRVVLAPVAGVKLAEVHEPNRALMSH